MSGTRYVWLGSLLPTAHATRTTWAGVIACRGHGEQLVVVFVRGVKS